MKKSFLRSNRVMCSALLVLVMFLTGIQSYAQVISAVADPVEGGAVTGAGSYAEGSVCTLTASANEGYTFINWTEDGEVVSLVANYCFTVRGDRDLVAHFSNEVPGVMTQTLPLTSGWNWISSYVDYRPETLVEMQNAIASECEAAVIKSEGDGFVNYSFGEWDGSLSTMDNFQMYLVKVDHDMTYSFEGDQTVVDNHPINLVPGWNWLGYPVSKPMELTEALSDLEPRDGDLIKSLNSFSSFEASEGRWQGTLTTLEPGKGYVYLSSVQEDRNFVLAGPSVPVVTTDETRGVGTWNAWCSGEIVRSGGFGITECGICWNTTGNPTIYDSHVTAELSDRQFLVQLENLNDSTDYYFRAYAINQLGVGYGEVKSFLTYPVVNAIVDIPENMDATDVVVTNFEETVVPDEDGNFEIGYSNWLVAKNAENGQLMYFSLCLGENNEEGRMRGNFTDLNAKESAVFLALRLMPIDLSSEDHDVLELLKEIVYSLPCVQNLEAVIQSVVDAYGYLVEEMIVDAVAEVSTFLFNAFSAVDDEIETSNSHVTFPQSSGLSTPEIEPDHLHGIKLRINDTYSYYYSNPDRWRIICNGYSSAFCPVRIVDGYWDGMNSHFTENPTGHTYAMPAMSVSQYAKLAEKMGLLMNGGWLGWMELYRQMKMVMNNEEYMLELTNITMNNMVFELPRTSNVIGVLTPADDHKTKVCAIITMVLDLIGAIPGLPSVNHDLILNTYMLDVPYMNFCRSMPQTSWGVKQIVQATIDKLPDVLDAALSVDGALDLINSIYYVNNVCNGMDVILSLIKSSSLKTFAFPVTAEYYGISLPSVKTEVLDVISNTVSLRGTVEGGASAAIAERGFVYGDLSNSESTWVTVGSGTGVFETTVEDLTTGHSYYVMAYAKTVSGELIYGREKTFLVYDGGVSVLAFEPAFTSTEAFFRGVVYDQVELLPPIVQTCGFYYGVVGTNNYHYTSYGSVEMDEMFFAFVDDLLPNTTYEVAAYAVILVEGYQVMLTSDVHTFFTGNHPTVTTHEVSQSNVGTTTATVTGSVVFPDENEPVEYERGFVISTSPDPISLVIMGENEHVTYNGTELLNFSYTFDDLWPNTPYYVRAYSYSKNNEIVYGDVKSFHTLDDDISCSIIIELYDSYGDGWNGNKLRVTFGDGHSEIFTIANGSSNTVTLDVNHGDHMVLSWVTGNYIDECSFLVKYSNGNVIYQSSGLGNGFSYEFDVDCVNMPGAVYEITVEANIAQGGTVGGGGSFEYGSSCYVTASANPGYTFMYWTVNGQQVAPVPSFSFTVNNSYDLTAVFTENNGDGQLSGVFTVGRDTRVRFAKGNLIYQASTHTWSFAGNQYDCMAVGNSNISSNNSYWIDLYGWGTSGWNSGAAQYQPYSTSTNNADYYTGGSPNISLTGAYANADWAFYNAISNGGQREGLWRCLTHEEYIYLIETRDNAAQKYAFGNVNGINGLIILPDEWSLPNGLSFATSVSSWYQNSYNVAQWALMEAAGAVFLPATGSRQGNYPFYFGNIGDYWSSTAADEETGHSMSFFNGTVYPADVRYRMLGTSVRPVREVH